MPASAHQDDAITALGACALSDAIHARRMSCHEVMQAYLERIHRLNPRYQALVSLRPDTELLAEARACDAELARGQPRGWMHGMPQAIKDLADARGLPTSAGSPLVQGTLPQHDGLMVARMRAAGCIVIGKTNVPEFGLGSHTFNAVFGTTANAYDDSKSAGGSSGGAAAALALRLLPVADGSDFMGSLRNPAAWANCFGLRPSQGRVPLEPARDAWISQLGTEGPMGRSVRDVARLLATQAGYSDRSPLSLDSGLDVAAARPAANLKRLRVGWLGNLDGHLATEPGILEACETALHRLEAEGALVEPAQLAMDAERVWRAWLTWRQVLVGARLRPLLAREENRKLMKPEALWEYDQGRDCSAADLMEASVVRTEFHAAMLGLFQRFDLLALPTAQVWPFDKARRWPDAIGERAMDTYHRWMETVIYATFGGLPCASVPAGFNAAGLPTGMQLIGPPRADAAVLQAAATYEALIADLLAATPPD
ncbi:MAG: amidase [Ottowia sp.]